ncbi:guanylate kinase [Oceanithermus profundus]|uniref:Guanylate kinase n=1 Tax=Oceanithermus profundus (strain DSM 14977 / NBRC 100410 / VKM B-2274 / 506) TaxID=670487 RepID=E4U9B3_OCEP5|nr:guanylate kinase [Oceanithermus profundus]ADR36942.1 guanylate kinase [Oceanithermus profundus DSM 14977]
MRGDLFVMTGASGVGKGTLRARLMERVKLHYSISMTTRPPREGERHGIDYWFVDEATFERTKREGGFLEYATYVDHSYGTPRAPVERALERGEDVLLEIEVQGALQVAEKMPEAQLIFVIPPSLSELRQRLLLRGKDTLEKIEKRLERAREEIALADRFHYVVVNDLLADAVADLERIIMARRRIVNRMRPALERALERDPDLEAELDEIAKRMQRR